jgi:hypothetical protein
MVKLPVTSAVRGPVGRTSVETKVAVGWAAASNRRGQAAARRICGIEGQAGVEIGELASVGREAEMRDRPEDLGVALVEAVVAGTDRRCGRRCSGGGDLSVGEGGGDERLAGDSERGGGDTGEEEFRHVRLPCCAAGGTGFDVLLPGVATLRKARTAHRGVAGTATGRGRAPLARELAAACGLMTGLDVMQHRHSGSGRGAAFRRKSEGGRT